MRLSLFMRKGDNVNTEQEPWKGICCKRCYYAKGTRCTCKCKGKHHGEGRKPKEMEGENRFPLLGWNKT